MTLMLGVAALTCWACSRTQQPTPPNEAAQAKSQPANTPAPATAPAATQPVRPPAVAIDATNGWNDELLAIAAQYKRYTKMADSPGWGPTLCMGPRFDDAFISEAKEGSAHGRKLYFLWVKDYEAYPLGSPFDWVPKQPVRDPQPVGQVAVKESFTPGKDASPDDPNAPRTLGERADLFIMFKADPATTGTDKGWVYGTVAADGKSVTSSGLLENCMGCHEDAKHDRLFGMVKTAGRADQK